ncbi:ABC transporter substrate-binding protein [Clostridium sp. 19966]|uniref:ABC transporter substrate-binding protein n=1 Tax=Clostridium sp. 19966 TaxID=2768166 RepID=UPI0028DF5CBA|nr:ABC transporter substrate-binding protein [Clostridium sp. 19966]MDT8718561.1 ABC transporter substrate-binding protein [Clostridium sp. 19966]
MNKVLKKLTLAIALTMTMAAGFSGCSSKQSSSESSDPSKLSAVKLKMYLLGDKPKDYDAVYGKVNDIMKKKINATLDVQFISWGDMNTKYPLLFSSGDDFDLIFTASGWCFYNQMAVRNGFSEITTDMLKKDAPNTYKNEPKVAWDQAKVNGKIYMVPNDQGHEYSYNVFAIRGDLREKYGIPEIKSEADLEKYYDAVAKNEKGIVSLVNGGVQNLYYPYAFEGNGLAVLKGANSNSDNPSLFYKLDDTSGKVVSIVDTDAYKDYVVKMKQFADNGYWSKSSLSSKETRDDAFKAGKAASMVWNIGSAASDAASINAQHPDWKVEIVDIHPGVKKVANPYTNNGMAINASSQNVDRALMALDLLRYDKDIYNLTTFGIEGTHWQAVGDKQYKELSTSSNFPANNVCPWGWHVDSMARTDESQPAIVDQMSNKWAKEDTVNNILQAFNFDDSNVKNEMAAVNNVTIQYGIPLSLGVISDPVKGLETYKQKLKEAGLDKIQKEAQKQVDAFIKGTK